MGAVLSPLPSYPLLLLLLLSPPLLLLSSPPLLLSSTTPLLLSSTTPLLSSSPPLLLSSSPPLLHFSTPPLLLVSSAPPFPLCLSFSPPILLSYSPPLHLSSSPPPLLLRSSSDLFLHVRFRNPPACFFLPLLLLPLLPLRIPGAWLCLRCCGVRPLALARGLVLAQAAMGARCLFQLPDTRLQRSDLFRHVRFRNPPA